MALDTDGDRIQDFDEQVRFALGPYDDDSDNVGVDDKEDTYEHDFDSANGYAKRIADWDADGARKETDPDNDADTFNDGCEDANGNGVFEPASGETDNFSTNTGLTCGEKPIHAIVVLDRSGSMASPASAPINKYEHAADATALFLDAWLASDPPNQTKVGLVYYDNTAYFDTTTYSVTTLQLLSDATRDNIVNSFASNTPNYGSTSIGGGILKAMDTQGFNTSAIPADDQHRVIMVLTDGKENTGIRMDDPSVIGALVSGKVDGYALGIGDEYQIDVDKLDALAGILNHPPASLAKDLSEFQLEKFFLQVLAETQGMEFSVDPIEQINPGQTKSHTLPVNPGAARVTFVVVWNEACGKIAFTLQDPSGQAVPADVTKSHDRYQITSKSSPAPGPWTLTLDASTTCTPAPSRLTYSIMAMEKNEAVTGNFEIRGVDFLTGDQLRLVATLSKAGRALPGGTVVVNVEQPAVGLGTFTSEAQVAIPDRPTAVEKGQQTSPWEQKLQAMAHENVRIPTVTKTLVLNDEGKDGDEIPGDGEFTGIFKDTRYDGIYTFRFAAKAGNTRKIAMLNREKVMTVRMNPRIRPQMSPVQVLNREFQAADKRTHMSMNITPKDRFGNLLGPGKADLLQLDVRGTRVINAVDKLNGTYEVEVTVPGEYRGTPGLLATFSGGPRTTARLRREP